MFVGSVSEKKLTIKDLIPDDQNFNTGNEFGEALIEKSFSKFGAGRSILLDKNNRIIAGNKSTQKFVESGGENVVVVESDGKTLIAVKRTDIDLNTKKGREMALADNASAKANITWDFDAIAEWEMPAQEWGIELPEDVTEGTADAEPQIDKAAELNEKWKVKLGDLWQIGEHRLLCGDSTSKEDVERTIGGATIGSVVTDPPYGLNKNIENDGKEWLNVLIDSSALFPECRWFVFCASSPDLFIQACSVINPDRILIWQKPFTLTPPVFGIAWHFEPVLFKSNGGKSQTNIGDVITEAAIATKSHPESQPHPTQKPQALMAVLIETSDGNVYEPFAGSGTTIVACQNLGRKCFALELTPDYCAVILERMSKAFPELEIKRIEMRDL